MDILVSNENNYKLLIREISGQDILIDYVLTNSRQHTAINSPLVVLIRILKSDRTFIINFGHQDLIIDKNSSIDVIIQSAKTTFVIDKKRFINLFKNKNVTDLLIVEFERGNLNIEHEFPTEYHNYIKYKMGDSLSESNQIIPFSKHRESFEKKVMYFNQYTKDFVEDYSFVQINGIITETLSDIERNGLCVDVEKFNEIFKEKGTQTKSSLVYSEYNIFTSTGRPSNRFDKINYGALNKDDGTRDVFVSRFGKDGMLFGIDYSAYHPHIIMNLTNYHLDKTVDVYDYLGQSYFNKTELSTEDLKKSKNITFQNLYGGVKDEYKNIEYFRKVNEYIDHRWKFFNENGYVETPVFKRRITSSHIHDPNPNKLFNYLLQAAETEFSIQNIHRVNEYLSNKLSKVVLYTYDSILVDTSKDDKKETLSYIKDLMVDNQFPVKCQIGNNYGNMVKIPL